MKKYLLGLISGIIITSIVAGAAITYNAKDILYSNDSSEVDNVQDAISEIYESGDALASEILEGKEALVNGKLIHGTGKLKRVDFSNSLVYQGTATCGSACTSTFNKTVTYDVSMYKGYENFTTTNLKCSALNYASSSNATSAEYSASSASVKSLTYNASTGKYTVVGTASVQTNGKTTVYLNCTLFYFDE